MHNQAMEFAADFIKFAEKVGIYDQFDRNKNTMTQSAGITALINQAKKLFPSMPKGETARLMRNLTDEARDAAIDEATDKVIDARALFSKKIAENGGARGLLQQIVSAESQEELKAAIHIAYKLIRADENGLNQPVQE